LKLLLKISILLALGIGFILGLNYYIARSSSATIYESIDKVPHTHTALLLGTAKYLAGGYINYYYKYRIDATVKLWKAGKIDAIIVSGDNGSVYYDEATAMYDDLKHAGIPAKYITRDYAGFRTLDSIVRAKKIFGQDGIIIVSQKFHLERALYIARAKGVKAIGFRATDFANTLWAKRMQYREYLARVKAFLDLYILRTRPKFLGEKVKVEHR